jgi:predicted O-linked N-acetylglucosamine transferase (SPINDLY family)
VVWRVLAHCALDLFLDTWPYNAGTTANDASRRLPPSPASGKRREPAAASQLRAMTYPSRHRRSAEYEHRAIEPRGHRKNSMRCKEAGGTRASSLLFDMERYTRRFEDALAAAWDDYERTSAAATS